MNQTKLLKYGAAVLLFAKETCNLNCEFWEFYSIYYLAGGFFTCLV